MTSGPYAEAAWLYRGAGWAGVLPLPPGRKGPPPGGFTGWAGVEPSGADVQAWCDGPQAAGNIGLRLPLGVYGLDVDDYGGKTGGAALSRLVQAYGPLPATWTVSSREDTASGIRLLRAELAPGRRWRDEPGGHGAGVEAIHRGHRYAVAWPSMHPDTGRKYVWRRPDGMLADGELPRPTELPALPAAWVEGLSEPGEVRTGELAGHEETVALVTGWREGQACPRVRDAHERALRGLRAAADGAALHPASRDGIHELANLGHEGHAGARRALAEHYGVHVEVRAARDGSPGAAEAEWWRMVRGAVGKLPGAARERCDCDLWSGEGLAFEPDLRAIVSGGEQGPSTIEVGAEGGGPLDLAAALDARVLTAAQMRDMPPPAQLVAGLLCLHSESWLIAKSGSYKTFIALDIAGHVGAGRPWMGRPVVRGDVFYLVAEGVGGMGSRVRAWEQRNGEMAGVVFLPMPVQIKREDHWAALVEVCRRRQPVLIILDTQARITVGLNENDNSEMGEMVEAIGRLRRATGACVLVVHHLGRNGSDARGASAIDGAQDSELRLTRGAGMQVTLETDKQRHLPDKVRVELELFTCQLDNGGTSLVVGPPLSVVRAEPDWRANLPINQLTLVDVMRDIFPAVGATKAELKSEVLRRGRRGVDGAPLAAMSESAFRRAWDALVDEGRFVRVDGTQRYVLTETELGMSR